MDGLESLTVKDLVTLVLAVWGAGLSTLLAVRQVRRDRPRVKVRVLGLARILHQDERPGLSRGAVSSG